MRYKIRELKRFKKDPSIVTDISEIYQRIKINFNKEYAAKANSIFYQQ